MDGRCRYRANRSAECRPRTTKAGPGRSRAGSLRFRWRGTDHECPGNPSVSRARRRVQIRASAAPPAPEVQGLDRLSAKVSDGSGTYARWRVFGVGVARWDDFRGIGPGIGGKEAGGGGPGRGVRGSAWLRVVAGRGAARRFAWRFGRRRQSGEGNGGSGEGLVSDGPLRDPTPSRTPSRRTDHFGRSLRRISGDLPRS
jgi:hypothetical protein